MAPKDDDPSLEELFKKARERKKEREATFVQPLLDHDSDPNQNVEKLVRRLENFECWEIRSLLVSVLLDGRVDMLKKFLIGEGSEDTTKMHESPTTSDRSAPSTEKEGTVSLGSTQADRACLGTKEDHRTPSTYRRSGSIGRRRATRSLSADKQLVAMSLSLQCQKDSEVEGSRQATILAKRRELDDARNKAKEKGGDAPQQQGFRRELTSPRADFTRKNRCAGDLVSSRRTIPARPRHGSADNLVGLKTNSMHGESHSDRGKDSTHNIEMSVEGLCTETSAVTRSQKIRVGTPPVTSSRPRSSSAENLLGLGAHSLHGERRSDRTKGSKQNLLMSMSLDGTSSDKSIPPRRLQRSQSLRSCAVDLSSSGRRCVSHRRVPCPRESNVVKRSDRGMIIVQPTKTAQPKNWKDDESTLDGSVEKTTFLQMCPGQPDHLVEISRPSLDRHFDTQNRCSPTPFEAGISKMREDADLEK